MERESQRRGAHGALCSASVERSRERTSTSGWWVHGALRSASVAGLAGFGAQVASVLALMPLRTAASYQAKNGGSTAEAVRALHADGGVRRFYRGLVPALILSPLTRFGDVAANAGALAAAEGLFAETETRPSIAAATVAASALAAGWRAVLAPVDTWKTTLQVEGNTGLEKLREKVRGQGARVLFHGAFGAAASSVVGFLPWWVVNNYLDHHLPKADKKASLAAFLWRAAAVGFCASAASALVQNPMHVLKTHVQTSATSLSYAEALRRVAREDGLQGVLLRGLQTRLLASVAQGVLFSVLWRLGEAKLRERHGGRQPAPSLP